MTVLSEDPFRPGNSLEIYQASSDSLKSLLTEGECALSQRLEWLSEGLLAVNIRLIEGGRGDLALEKPAAMAPVARPSDITESFTRGFVIYTGVQKSDPEDRSGSLMNTPIAVTEDEIAELRGLPNFRDYEQQLAVRESTMFPAVSKAGEWGWDIHTDRSAFLRSLVLFPDFMTRLVLAASAPENFGRARQFDTPSFAAYTLMSSLVDRSDLSVMRGQRVNDRYLLGPAAS